MVPTPTSMDAAPAAARTSASNMRGTGLSWPGRSGSSLARGRVHDAKASEPTTKGSCKLAIAAAINRISSVLHPAGGDGLRDDLEESFADQSADDNFRCDEQAFSARHRWERQIVMVVSCAGPDVVRPQVHGSQPYRQDIWP